jgi:hypothetical protein
MGAQRRELHRLKIRGNGAHFLGQHVLHNALAHDHAVRPQLGAKLEELLDDVIRMLARQLLKRRPAAMQMALWPVAGLLLAGSCAAESPITALQALTLAPDVFAFIGDAAAPRPKARGWRANRVRSPVTATSSAPAMIMARAYRSGAGLREATQRLRFPRFERWALYETLHPRNVHHEFLRLEAQDLAR